MGVKQQLEDLAQNKSLSPWSATFIKEISQQALRLMDSYEKRIVELQLQAVDMEKALVFYRDSQPVEYQRRQVEALESIVKSLLVMSKTGSDVP